MKLLLPILLPLLACAARAQEASIAYEDNGRAIATLSAFYANGASVAGGLAFVRADVHNVDSGAHTCDVEVLTRSWDDADVRVTWRMQLGPQERGRVFLPVPTPVQVSEVRLVVDGTAVTVHQSLSQTDAAVALAVLARPDLELAATAAVRVLPSSFANPTRVVVCQVDDLPSDWRLFTGFHSVVVDGRAALAEGVQEALRRYVFAGGTVLVAEGQRLGAGSLRALANGAPVAKVAHGLGCALFTGPLGSDTGQLHGLVERLAPAGQGVLPVDGALQQAQLVPGLGQARVAVFLAIILVFAIAVGPVNFLWLRRRRKPLLALITVPVLGFGTTLVILAYGFFHDGFGVRGTVTSWTFVDQQRHEAVAIAARTLFSGLAPGSLAMGADAIVLAPRASHRRERLDRWHFEPAAQRLDGGAVPSRVPTPLVGIQQGLVRQRLVVRFGADVAQLLPDGGLQPTGTVVLRDHDGSLWCGEAPTLRRVASGEAETALQALRRDGSAVQLETQRVRQRHGGYVQVEEVEAGPRSIGALGESLFTVLAPGEFVARVAQAPWLDEHDLAVDYDRQLHFVRGRLSQEDCLR